MESPKYILPIKFAIDEKSDIHRISNFYKYTDLIFGLKSLCFEPEKVETIGKAWKIYSVLYSILSMIGILFCISFDLQMHYDYVLTTYLSYFAIYFGQFAIILNNAFFSSINGLKLYISMTKIDKFFDYRRKTFRTFFLTVNLLYLIVKCYKITIDYICWPSYYKVVFYISMTTRDMRILHYIFAVYILARRFEALNDFLANLLLNKHSIDVELYGGFLSNFWCLKNETKTTKILKIDQLLAAFNVLSDSVDNLNNFFGISVSNFQMILKFCVIVRDYCIKKKCNDSLSLMIN